MKLARKLASVGVLLAFGMGLGGCVIVPVPIGHGRYDRDRYDHRYDAPYHGRGDARDGGDGAYDGR